MKYIVLLRKINVGKDNRIDKKSLEKAFIALGYSHVEIYINSGNVIFNTTKGKNTISDEVDEALFKLFNARIQFLIKTINEMREIRKAIPNDWENDDKQKTDIAYLFTEIDNPKIVNELPIKKEYMEIIYVKGALIMNVKREYLNKSQYSKIVGSEVYKHMTLRNVNTARHLADISD